jgi:thioredoxin 1
LERLLQAFLSTQKIAIVMILELEKDNLQEILDNNTNVVVQYSATWCGNCRIMKPKFKKEASINENITFVIADAEKFPESRKLANVDNLPTFAAFTGGKLKNQVQTNKYDVLKELISEITYN